MLAALVRFLIALFPWLSYDYRHRRVKRKQTCLACGNRVKVDIRYNPVEKLVVCGCPVCLATWGYNPIVQSQKWAKPAVEGE